MRVPLHGEDGSGAEIRRRGREADARLARPVALGAAARVVLREAIGVAVGAPAVGHGLAAAARLAEAVAGSIVVALEQRGLGGLGRVRAGERVPRSTEVVVREGHARRHHVRCDVHVRHAEVRGRPAWNGKGPGAEPRPRRVREDEASPRRPAVRRTRAHVVEEAAHEVEVALSVLRPEAAPGSSPRAERRLDAPLAEDLLRDVGHGQVLEDAVARRWVSSHRVGTMRSA